MFFSIDPHNGVPIYEQLVRQIKFAVAEGIVQPGQMLPSVRSLSQQLTINPNTINRAYQQLQQDQVASPVRGLGLSILPDAIERCCADRYQVVTDRMRGVLSEALHAGLTGRQIEKIFKELMGQLSGQVPTVAATVSPD